MKQISAEALSLLWFVELQGAALSVAAGAWEAMKESPENHKWSVSEQAVTAKL